MAGEGGSRWEIGVFGVWGVGFIFGLELGSRHISRSCAGMGFMPGFQGAPVVNYFSYIVYKVSWSYNYTKHLYNIRIKCGCSKCNIC